MKCFKLLRKRNGEAGFSLLEYGVGAAVILSVVFIAMGDLGDSMTNLLNSIGGWADARAGEIPQ
jgi:hypothetical protein